MTDRSRQLLELPDGRTLCFAEKGDPDGFPVVSLHGTPGTRLGPVLREDDCVREGLRVITIDRPGYGDSTRRPGRRVVDVVEDIEALLDHLDVEELAAIGGSGGGPHVLALAARLRRPLRRAVCAVGIVPYPTEGLDWFAGMDPLNVTEFTHALHGEADIRRHLEQELAAMVERTADDPTKFLGDDWELHESDRAAMSHEAYVALLRATIAELQRAGVDGWVDDDLAFTRPWGFDIAEIQVPVLVVYGAHDVLVPAAHGAWLAQHVPGAQVDVREESGHFGSPEGTLALLLRATASTD